MSQLIESICLEKGLLKNLEYHQARIDRAFNALFPDRQAPHLGSNIVLPEVHGVYKCRFVYDADSFSYTFERYKKKLIKTMKLVEVDNLDYTHKYLDRHLLDIAYKQRNHCDDIVMIKHGLVTDSYYANLVFFDGSRWYTPKHPLLRGTKREQLLGEGLLMESDITKDDIREFKKISLINAMLDLGDMTLNTSQIHD